MLISIIFAISWWLQAPRASSSSNTVAIQVNKHTGCPAWEMTVVAIVVGIGSIPFLLLRHFLGVVSYPLYDSPS